MYTIAVGQKLEGIDKLIGQERYQFNYDMGGSQLFIMIPHLTSNEITVFREGEFKFALSTYGEIIFLHFKLTMLGVRGGFDWSECPFTIHLVPPEDRKIPDRVPHNWGLLCTALLVESETGIVQALRMFTFSNKFSLKLSELIETQYFSTFEEKKYDEKLAWIYQNYTSKDLLKNSIVKCTAGIKED